MWTQRQEEERCAARGRDESHAPVIRGARREPRGWKRQGVHLLGFQGWGPACPAMTADIWPPQQRGYMSAVLAPVVICYSSSREAAQQGNSEENITGKHILTM